MSQDDKIEIIEKILDTECYICKGSGKQSEKECRACNGSGIFKKRHFYHVYKGMCFDSDMPK